MPIATTPTRDITIETHVFWLRFRKEIAAAVIILLLAIVGFGAFRFYADRQDIAGATLLASAKTIQDYQQVIAHYPNTPAGAGAYLLLADRQRADKKLGDANATLQAFVNKNPDHELATTARMAIANNLDSMGKTDEALAMYQQIATGFPKSFSAPLALISRVHLLKVKNRPDEARLACETILTQYRDSFWAREAAQELRFLKPSAPSSSISTPASGPAGQSAAPPSLLVRPPMPAPSAAPTAKSQ
ncbi:MAG: tetratricopeptide repeat protein [Verrucomicrobiota bacterium]